MAKVVATATVYHLKVYLGRQIWRRIAIRGDQTLEVLHWAIFDAFDREDDEHLYEFSFPALDSRGRPRKKRPTRYSHPAAAQGDDRDASLVTIDALQLRPRRTFEYVFDFGASWEHEIVVETTDAEDDG